MRASLRASLFFALLICLASVFLYAQAPGPQQPPEFVKQGQQLIRDGKPDEALTLYRQTLKENPSSVPALIAAGSVLDLMGKNDEAQKYFAMAIVGADSLEGKVFAKRAMAISYAFEGNCKEAVEYEQQVFDFAGSKKDFSQQGEIADETGRICLDSGDLDAAAKWYKLGHDTGIQEPGLKTAQKDLWDFRWEHAQGRIAARRGDKAEAQRHVAAAKAILDKGTNHEQEPFFPVLKGYVAFYSGDYPLALKELMYANTKDPFIQCLLGQTYEKLGDKDKAMEQYRLALRTASHNPAAAYAVPFSRKKLS
jgi:tetratricopeptide (TPR) repeat protein